MRKKRVLLITHESLVPPEDAENCSDEEMLLWKTEYDVKSALDELGHEVRVLGLAFDLGALREVLLDFKPHIVFNLLEEFHHVALYDQHIVGYLELMKQPYTGCNPRGLMLSHDKVLSKKILSYHRIRTPKFFVAPIGKRKWENKLGFPLLVKSATEDSSLGIAQASVVRSEKKLDERIQFIHESIQTDALVEEYIEGRELYLSILGNKRLTALPLWEVDFSHLPDNTEPIASRRVKWDLKYNKKYKIENKRAEIDPEMEREIAEYGKRIYRRLHLNGYARLDFRLREDGRYFLLEANANPNISLGEDLPEAAEASGISYPELIQEIIKLGLKYEPEWKKYG